MDGLSRGSRRSWIGVATENPRSGTGGKHRDDGDGG